MGLSTASARCRRVRARIPLHRGPVLATIEGASGSRIGRSCRPRSDVHDALRVSDRRHRVCLRPAHSAPNAVCVTAFVQPVELMTQLYVGDMLRERIYPWRVVKRDSVPRLLILVCATQSKQLCCIFASTKSPSATGGSRQALISESL